MNNNIPWSHYTLKSQTTLRIGNEKKRKVHTSIYKESSDFLHR